MGEEVKKERADLVVLDADPVDAVVHSHMTVNIYLVNVKYQKIGRCSHPHRGSAQAVGYDVYSAVSREIPAQEKLYISRATSSQNPNPVGV